MSSALGYLESHGITSPARGVLGLYGEQDLLPSPGELDEWEQQLSAAPVAAELVRYPDAGHAFDVEEADVRLLAHERPFPAPVGPPLSRLDLLTIATDEGIEGHTFAGAPGEDVAGPLHRQVRPMLIAQDPLDIGWIWALTARRGLPASLQGAVDVALWGHRGEGRRAPGAPPAPHRARPRRPTPHLGARRGPGLRDEALAYKQQGIRGHKLHPLTQLRRFRDAEVPVTADIELCRQLRAAVGESFPLFLDSAWAYPYGEEVRVGLAIQELGYQWYEDPLPADDLYGYVRLKQQLSIPIMATEITGGGLTALAPRVVEQATDFLRGDVVLKGGITGMLKIAHLAEEFHLGCEVHDAYNSLNNLASLHLIMAIPNCAYDLDHLIYGLTEPIAIDGEGFASLPDRPGLGIDVDWALLRSGTSG